MKRALGLLGIDANVGWTFVARLVSLAAGFLALFPLTHFLSASEQGYYFTFASITALQTLFELGLTQILVQITSHEFPFLPEDVTPAGVRQSIHGRRLAFFAGFANRWYLLVSLSFVIVTAILGTVYFASFGKLGFGEWAPAWIGLVVVTGLNLYISPRLAFIEGAGFPGKVAAIRVAHTILGYSTLTIMLLAGLGLWAALAIPLMQALISLSWLARNRSIPNFFHRTMRSLEQEPGWRNEIMGLQWRVALSWIGGYLATLAFTPLLFAYQGAASAGRWGLSFSLSLQIIALGTSWSTAKTPRYGELIARGDKTQLDAEFKGATIRSLILVTIGFIGLVVAVAIANAIGLKIAERLISQTSLIFLGLASIANAAVFCLAVYMRAHKEEPLAASSVVLGVITAGTAFLAVHFGEVYVAVAYFVVTAFISLPWRWLIYRGYRDRKIAS